MECIFKESTRALKCLRKAGSKKRRISSEYPTPDKAPLQNWDQVTEGTKGETKTPAFSCKTGLSLRAGGRGFSPVTKRVAPGYFYWKIEEK